MFDNPWSSRGVKPGASLTLVKEPVAAKAGSKVLSLVEKWGVPQETGWIYLGQHVIYWI